MSLLNRLFGSPGPDPKVRLLSLYDQIVAKAREPHWYVEGQVPDSIDGRFDMVSAVLALVLMRLEDSADHSPDMARLTEVFVDDMDGQMREAGIGDVIVGKHIGKMRSALARIPDYCPLMLPNAGRSPLGLALRRLTVWKLSFPYRAIIRVFWPTGG